MPAAASASKASPSSRSRAPSPMGSPSTQIRSVTSTRWGEVVQPTTKPAAFSMCARKAPVLPLPLVPANRMTG